MLQSNNRISFFVSLTDLSMYQLDLIFEALSCEVVIIYHIDLRKKSVIVLKGKISYMEEMGGNQNEK